MVLAVDDNAPPDPLVEPLPLSDLWQALEQVIRYPEQLALAPLFSAMAQAIAPLPLSEQLAIAGLVFDKLADVVGTRSALLMESWESWHRPSDPILDFSHDPDLFVQSQRLEFSDLFDASSKAVFYPFERKSLTSPDSAFDERGGGEGGTLEGLLSDALVSGADLPIVNLEPTAEADVVETIKALSHSENIPLWSAQVSEAMRSLVCAECVSLTQTQRREVKSLPLTNLQQSLQMPLAEVWLALLLGDSGYQLTRPASGELADFTAWSEAFYSVASLQVSAVE